MNIKNTVALIFISLILMACGDLGEGAQDTNKELSITNTTNEMNTLSTRKCADFKAATSYCE